MASLLVRGADVLVTMDDARREIAGGWLRAEDGVVVAVGGPGDPEERAAADAVTEAAGCVVTPGLVNTHHHLFQSLVRAVPGGQDALLFGWLKSLYPIFARMGPEDIQAAVTLGLAELALSGCTCAADHQYIFPNGAQLDHSIEAAGRVGIRFHATRGAMSIGESAGGLPPDFLTEREPAILADMERVVDAFHDPSPGAMVRVGLAPCSPFTVSTGLMRDAAVMARAKGVMLHTHLAENDEDVEYSLEHYGCRPGQYAEELGWTGEDVWHAHCVKLDAGEIDLFARTGTGIAHCPSSNCRLGSGIAPLRALVDARVKLGLGVDGSASNDAAHLLLEARQAMLLQRVANGADAFGAREALEIATRGGAAVLGRDDLGSLAPGKRADFALWDMSGLPAAGLWDPVAGLVLSGPFAPKALYVEGRPVVTDGRLALLEERVVAERLRARAAGLAGA
ncbi:MAG: 8-oxoguanine deaminase [Pseudomonadota bacterium]